jgi:hypothetical protein
MAHPSSCLRTDQKALVHGSFTGEEGTVLWRRREKRYLPVSYLTMRTVSIVADYGPLN